MLESLNILDWLVILGTIAFASASLRFAFGGVLNTVKLKEALDKTKAELKSTNQLMETETARIVELTKENEQLQEKQLEAFFNLTNQLSAMTTQMIYQSITKDGYCSDMMLWLKVYTFNYANFYDKHSRFDKEFDRNVQQTVSQLKNELYRIYGQETVGLTKLNPKAEAMIKEILALGDRVNENVVFTRLKETQH